MTAAPAPVYVVVDPAIDGYTPTLAAYPTRDLVKVDLLALVTMSQGGAVQIREFTGRERTGTWEARKAADGRVETVFVRRRG